jgi:hypothetical protein
LQFIRDPGRIGSSEILNLQDAVMRTVFSGICGFFAVLALGGLTALPVQPASLDDDSVCRFSENNLEIQSGDDSAAPVEPASPVAPLLRNPRVRLATGLVSRHSLSTIRLGATPETLRAGCSLLPSHSLSIAPTLQAAQIRLQI